MVHSKRTPDRLLGTALTEQEKQAKRARLRALQNGETPPAPKRAARKKAAKKAAKRRR